MSVRKFSKNNRGLSLLEAFLAALVFVIATAAVIATLNSLRKPAVNNEQATKAALVLSNFLDDMRAKVSADDYEDSSGDYSNLLKQGTNKALINVDGSGLYNIYYNVTVDATTGARQVDATISWTDAF